MGKQSANKETKVEETKKEFAVKYAFNLGSNKDGSPKKSYKAGDKILLSESQEKILKKQGKI